MQSTSAQQDPDPAGFINPESRPEVGIKKFGIRDPESVRDPLQCSTNIFFCGPKTTRYIIICKYFMQEIDTNNI
jgi:hypothetical protein